eukprot:PhF_6_TR13605/c0_g1_i1/m.21771
MNKSIRFAPFRLDKEAALQKIASHLEEPPYGIPWNWMKLIRINAVYLPVYCVSGEARCTYNLNVVEKRVIPSGQGRNSDYTETLIEGTSATLNRLCDYNQSPEMQVYVGKPNHFPSSRAVAVQGQNILAERFNNKDVKPTSFLEVDEVVPFYRKPAEAILDVTELMKSHIRREIKRSRTPNIPILEQGNVEYETTIRFPSFEFKPNEELCVAGFMPCYRAIVGFDGLHHTIAACGTTGKVSAPFIINPYNNGFVTMMTTLFGLSAGVATGSITAQMAGIAALPAVYCTNMAIASLSRWNQKRGKSHLATLGTPKTYCDFNFMTDDHFKACDVLQVPYNDLSLEDLTCRYHAALLRGCQDKDAVFRNSAMNAYRLLCE